MNASSNMKITLISRLWRSASVYQCVFLIRPHRCFLASSGVRPGLDYAACPEEKFDQRYEAFCPVLPGIRFGDVSNKLSGGRRMSPIHFYSYFQLVAHNLCQMVKDKTFRLLIPLLIFNGFEQGFLYSDFNKVRLFTIPSMYVYKMTSWLVMVDGSSSLHSFNKILHYDEIQLCPDWQGSISKLFMFERDAITNMLPLSCQHDLTTYSLVNLTQSANNLLRWQVGVCQTIVHSFSPVFFSAVRNVKFRHMFCRNKKFCSVNSRFHVHLP
jgi:hypothetical protein